MRPVEAQITRVLYAKASARKIPLSGTFELTPMCNFACRMCYVRKTAEEVRSSLRKMMTYNDWMRIAAEAKEQGMLYLLLTGGEPLSWPYFWKLYENMVNMGFLVSVNTNGSLIDKEAIEKFTAFPPARINITLYGASDQTYEALCQARNVYTKVKKAILNLKSAGITVKLNCSMTPYNISDLEEMVDFALKNELILDATPYMYPPIRRDESSVGVNDRFSPEEAARYNFERIRLLYGEDRYQQYLEEICEGTGEPLGLDPECTDMEDGIVRCRAGKASFWITWDGYMTPCGMLPEPKTEISNGFFEAWDQIVQMTSEIRLSSVCDQCPDYELCHVCTAMAYAETGSTTGIPTYLCKMVRVMKRIAKHEKITTASDEAVTNTNSF